MTSENYKRQAESTIAALLHGLRYRGLTVSPEDAAKVVTVFQHAAEWSHQRRVRVLKSILARSNEERSLIEQLAPFLFVEAQKRNDDSSRHSSSSRRQEEYELVQPRFSSNTEEHPKVDDAQPLDQLAGRKTILQMLLFWEVRIRWIFVSLVIAVIVALKTFQYVQEIPKLPAPLPREMKIPRGDSSRIKLYFLLLFGSPYKLGIPPTWLFQLLFSFSCMPIVIFVARKVRFQRQTFNLKLLKDSIGPRTYRFKVPPDLLAVPLDPTALREAAFHLSAPLAKEAAPWLDIGQTVEQTVRNAGQLTLCFDTWYGHQHVLFIEDISTSMVRWPDIGQQIASAMAHQGVTVVHYHMNKIPDRIFVDRGMRVSVPLEKVIANLAEPTIIILSDATAISPHGDGMKYPWLGALTHATWLHPQGTELWGPGAQWLSERLRVIPLCDDGLLHLGTNRYVPTRQWHPAQSLGNKIETRLATVREMLGEDVFWWLATGAMLDKAGALTSQLWWHLLSTGLLPASPPQGQCNRVWELPEIRVEADGTVSFSSDLGEALVKALREEQPQVLSRAVAWVEACVQADLKQPALQGLAAVQGRAFLAKLQSLDPTRRRAAAYTMRGLLRDGFGEWIESEEEENFSWLQRLLLAPTKQDKIAIAALIVGATGLVISILGLWHPALLSLHYFIEP